MNIGSLYLVKKWYWLLFPSKEFARTAPFNNTTAHNLTIDITWYSRTYNENVTYFPSESYVVFLEEDGNVKRILTSEGLIGWIRFDDHYNDLFEEIKSA